MDTTTTRDQLAEELVQIGRDEMAATLAEMLADAADVDQQYLDGVEDALLTLIQAGAADPR